jgi:hypothetical protein
VIKRQEYEKLFYNQQATLEATEAFAEDVPEMPYVVVQDDEEEEAEELPTAILPRKRTAVPRRSQKPPVPQPNPENIPIRYGVKSIVEPNPEPKEEEPKVDTSGVAVGVTVYHVKFGAGKVIELRNGYIEIVFMEGTKKFGFPEAFENGFLSV